MFVPSVCVCVCVCLGRKLYHFVLVKISLSRLRLLFHSHLLQRTRARTIRRFVFKMNNKYCNRMAIRANLLPSTLRSASAFCAAVGSHKSCLLFTLRLIRLIETIGSVCLSHANRTMRALRALRTIFTFFGMPEWHQWPEEIAYDP